MAVVLVPALAIVKQFDFIWRTECQCSHHASDGAPTGRVAAQTHGGDEFNRLGLNELAHHFPVVLFHFTAAVGVNLGWFTELWADMAQVAA